MADFKAIRRVIELVFDRRKGRLAQREAEKNVKGIDGALRRLRATALRVGAAMAAAFGVRAIARFARESVRAFAEQEEIWNRLAGTLQTVGVRFADVQLEIKGAARALQDITRIGDEDFADILQQLIVMTGDYETALRNVSLVADVAAGIQRDLRTASQLVGRALIGDTALLKRYGIIVEEGADAVEVMRKQFAGLAEVEAQGLQGSIAQLNNEWGDLKQAIGAALIGPDGGVDAVRQLRDVVKNLEAWVTRNGDSVRAFASNIVGLIGNIANLTKFVIDLWSWLTRLEDRIARIPVLGRMLGLRLRDAEEPAKNIADDAERAADATIAEARARADAAAAAEVEAEKRAKAAEKARQALAKEIGLLTQGAELQDVLNAAQVARLDAIHAQLTAERETNITLERRLELEKQLAEVTQARRTLADRARFEQLTRAAGAPPAPALARPSISQPTPMARDLLSEDAVRRAQQAREILAGIREEALRTGETVADFATPAFEEFFDALIQGFRAGEGAAESFGEAFVGLGRFVVAQLIEGLAQYAMAQGALKVAESIFPPNPAAAAAAAAYFTAAGLFKALAAQIGATGGTGGGGGGAATRVSGGAADATAVTALSEQARSDIYIFIDPLNPQDPAYQRNVQETTQLARERFGDNARIVVRPRSEGDRGRLPAKHGGRFAVRRGG